jgi:hypothetical protein
MTFFDGSFGGQMVRKILRLKVDGVLFLLGLFLLPLDLHATTLAGGSVQSLSKEASWIGRVQIETIETIPSSSQFPFTRVRGKVLEIFKGAGELGESISFQLPGGQRGTKSFAVVGMPLFKSGSEYVLFLDGTPRLGNTALSVSNIQVGLVGWTAFRVVVNERGATSARAVIRAGEPSLLEGSSRGLALSHDRSIRTYDDFVSEIYRSLD